MAFSFGMHQTYNVGFWHITALAAPRKFVVYWTNGGLCVEAGRYIRVPAHRADHPTHDVLNATIASSRVTA